ncbi:hypothetical protein BU26DRAFT_517498 [Trematosphaeria pertusa]|uniref:Uncharacterized protein n=1 Tax=Trematosphaeria pertusa TaxID=390896 RepID=A0A6A6IKT3_9PLEO|nr:uncharacterized protein BU26DRAFT_517498 [Trematosphaeria pertusa]KAF2250678.1 hypothetical protein BU26DRAFT_517498 [Trematosphaeria pertusa]
MSTSPSEVGIVELFGQLQPERIAIQVHSGNAVVRGVLEALVQHSVRRCGTDPAPALKEFDKNGQVKELLRLIEAGVQDMDIQKLADDKNTTSDAIRRVLAGILDHARKLQASDDSSTSNGVASHPPKLQAILGPGTYPRYACWHVSALALEAFIKSNGLRMS